MLNRFFPILIFFLLLSFCSFAQEEEQSGFASTELPTEFKKEITIDLRIHSTGFGVGANYGFIKKDNFTMLLHAKLISLKHHREVKQSFDFPGPSTNSPKAFIYGKQNNFYGFHLGIGGKSYLSQKAKRRAITVAVSYSVGPSLGILKPYYLELIRLVDGTTDFEIVSEAYSETNRAEFLSLNAIYGSSGFGFGIDELKFTGGGYLQGALHFDWGAHHQFIKGLEAGITLEAYGKKVPIMIPDVTDNKALFVNLYLALQFGKRS